MIISIIGTAGRKDDQEKLSIDTWIKMSEKIHQVYDEYGSEITYTKSGGAAWADHLAIYAYLVDLTPKLHLHLPCDLSIVGNSVSYTSNSQTGRIANYYHSLFSEKLRSDTLDDIKQAIDKGMTYDVSNGFFQRNILVGQCDILVAFTFGTKDFFSEEAVNVNPELCGLKDGGTAHTWTHSRAPVKIHYNLNKYV